MERFIIKGVLSAVISLSSIACAWAQEKTVYYDASEFPVYGQAFKASAQHPFRRLPESLSGVVREPVWNLGCCSAGIYVRFRTAAPEIHAKWTNNGNHMPHMTDCGTGPGSILPYMGMAAGRFL